MGRHRTDPGGVGRYLLLGVVAVVALALVIVGVLALRGALSTKKPAHTPASTSAGSPKPHTVQQSSAVPALLIKIIHEPCLVFVKNTSNNNILQSDTGDAPLGSTLQFVQIPLQVQISDPKCTIVYIHGSRQKPPRTGPWIFMVQG